MCVVVCPEDALTLEPVVVGTWFTGVSAYGPMAHARLLPAAESSGRLVTLVRQKAEDLAYDYELPLIIIDGPPGLGCTTTAALTETDLAIVVTEPSLSGIHDMERQVQLIEHFGLNAAVIINKFDINMENTQHLRAWCSWTGLPMLGRSRGTRRSRTRSRRRCRSSSTTTARRRRRCGRHGSGGRSSEAVRDGHERRAASGEEQQMAHGRRRTVRRSSLPSPPRT
jgi:MinD superfamily P-loop ATPase